MANDIDDIIESTESQCDEILKYCRKYGYITNKEAVAYLDCYRLSARIADLEDRGNVFGHEMFYYKDKDGKTRRFMKYRLLVEKVS